MDTVTLREVVDADLPIFFVQQLDPDANWMAAFGTADPAGRAAFDAHWSKIRSLETNTIRTILDREQVAGYVSSFMMEGDLEICYWLGREFWGQGIATEALRQFVALVPERPLHARVAKDNAGSLRVLLKCGFEITGEETSYATGRAEETVELLLDLR